MGGIAMFGKDFTIAQMEAAIRDAYQMGQSYSYALGLEDTATIICEAANLPMIDVISALQRLKEYRESRE